jgi:hypothetical protein
VVTKSGTNQFHGSFFEYYRGNTFATRNPFTTTTVLPPYYSHQFGGALGGALRVPKYDGHNRTFFFVNYEGQKQSGGGTRVATVAPAAFWQGNFSSLLPRVQLKDPLSPGNPPFPGDIIPASRLDPTALKLRPLFPDPTAAGLANNLVQSVNTIANTNQFTAKVDHLLPRNNSVSARLTYFNGGGFSPGILGTPNVGYVQPRHGENGVLSWTAPLNSSTVNEFRLGATTLTRYDIYFNGNFPNSDTLGMRGTVPISSNLVPPLPIIQFTGADAFTQLSYWPANSAPISPRSPTTFSASPTSSPPRAPDTSSSSALTVGARTSTGFTKTTATASSLSTEPTPRAPPAIRSPILCSEFPAVASRPRCRTKCSTSSPTTRSSRRMIGGFAATSP